MNRAFLEKFFPTSRVILLRKRISGIQQSQRESFPAYYERFKTLVASCPQHQMKEELLLQYFYEGLLPIERQILDASAGGALVDKTPVAAKILITNRALHAQQYEGVGQRDIPRQQVHEAKISKGMIHTQIHTIWDGAITQISNGGSLNNLNKEDFDSHPLGYIKGHSHNLNLNHKQLNQTQGLQNQNNRIANQDKEMSDMKKQIGQISEFLGQFREQGKLPSSTIVNPKEGFETTKAIMLRSVKELGNHLKPSKQGLNEDEKMLQEEKQKVRATAREDQLLPQPPKASKPSQTNKVSPNSNFSSSIPLSVPFPSRFRQSKKEENEKDILEIFRKVQVNIPLLDAIKQVPKYAKFLKKLCTTRKRILNKEVVQVNNLIFPVDFYVLDMEDSAHSTPLPILLGRPFMKTARTKIDVFKGTLTMEFDGEIIDFNISEAMKYPQDDRFCYSIDVFDLLASDYLDSLDKDPHETIIVEGLGVKPNMAVPNDEIGEMMAALGAGALPQHPGKFLIPISIPVSTNKLYRQ
ncbi:unnamed protein product [Malus baccata var. baccata]